MPSLSRFIDALLRVGLHANAFGHDITGIVHLYGVDYPARRFSALQKAKLTKRQLDFAKRIGAAG